MIDLVAATAPNDKMLNPLGLSRTPHEFPNHSWNQIEIAPSQEAYSKAPKIGHESSASLRKLEAFASIKRVKGRRGPLALADRKSAMDTRKMGACYLCRRAKVKVIGLLDFEKNYYSYEEI